MAAHTRLGDLLSLPCACPFYVCPSPLPAAVNNKTCCKSLSPHLVIYPFLHLFLIDFLFRSTEPFWNWPFFPIYINLVSISTDSSPIPPSLPLNSQFGQCEPSLDSAFHCTPQTQSLYCAYELFLPGYNTASAVKQVCGQLATRPFHLHRLSHSYLRTALSDVKQSFRPPTSPNGPPSTTSTEPSPPWLERIDHFLHLLPVLEFLRPESHEHSLFQCVHRVYPQHWPQTRKE